MDLGKKFKVVDSMDLKAYEPTKSVGGHSKEVILAQTESDKK